MLEFHPLQLEDLPRLRSFFNYSGSRICDTTPGTVFIWRDMYETEWAICDDSLYFKVEKPVPGEQLKHMVKKWYSGIHIVLSGTVYIEA